MKYYYYLKKKKFHRHMIELVPFYRFGAICLFAPKFCSVITTVRESSLHIWKLIGVCIVE